MATWQTCQAHCCDNQQCLSFTIFELKNKAWTLLNKHTTRAKSLRLSSTESLSTSPFFFSSASSEGFFLSLSCMYYLGNSVFVDPIRGPNKTLNKNNNKKKERLNILHMYRYYSIKKKKRIWWSKPPQTLGVRP